MNEETKKWRDALYDASVQAVERGWCIIPLSLQSKKPLVGWKKYQTEPTTLDEVEEWFDKGVTTSSGNVVPLFNIALVTGAISGVIVLDCDNEEAVQYAEKHNLTSPFVVHTARGKHFYFSHPQHGQRFANQAGGVTRNWPDVSGLDLRGDGGYVVMPPSIKLKDNAVQHQYYMEVGIGLGLDDLDDFVWKGAPDVVAAPQTGVFEFGNLNLSNVKAAQVEDALPVWDQVKRRVAHLGHKLREGEGTDVWMLRYVGQKVREGLSGENLLMAVRKFNEEFFDNSAYTPDQTETWLNTKIRSVVDMDKRSYPEDYDANGERVKKVAERPQLGRLVPIRGADVDRLISTLGETSYWSDPVIPSETITQVVGYNGHGKSFFLQGMLVSMSAGNESFGPFGQKPARVLYLDYDNPSRTVLLRFKNFINMFGDTGDNFNMWSPSLISADDGGEMNLGSENGFKLLGDWLEVIKPDIVVIDTVRNAFGGLEEANAAEWFKVNHVAKSVRTKYNASVIMVHHRNKPGEGGLGREAGSTAQLTDIDTQVMVTQVFRDKTVAKTKAGLHDADQNVVAYNGTTYTATTFLENQLEADSRIKMVQQISFGKVRSQTELHRTYYIGWAERLSDGSEYVVHTPSPKQQAVWLHIHKSMSVEDVSRSLSIPRFEVERWLQQ